MLADTGTIVVSCPTTEGSLGDGHFPALRHRRRRRADRDRLGLQRARGPVRGDAGARDAGPARAAHAPRAAGAPRRPLGVPRRDRARRASGSTTPGRSPSTATIPTCAAWPRPTSRSRSRRAPRPPSWRDPRAARVPRRGRRTRSRSSSCTRTRSRPARTRAGRRGHDLRAVAGAEIPPDAHRRRADGDRDRAAAGLAGLVTPRSGLAAQHGITLVNTPGLIDPNYRGEIKVILRNEGGEPFAVEPGDRIAQLLLVPFWAPEIEVVSALTARIAARRASARPAGAETFLAFPANPRVLQ